MRGAHRRVQRQRANGEAGVVVHVGHGHVPLGGHVVVVAHREELDDGVVRGGEEERGHVVVLALGALEAHAVLRLLGGVVVLVPGQGPHDGGKSAEPNDGGKLVEHISRSM